MSPQLNRLIQQGRVSAVGVILGPRDQPNRLLYWTKEFEEWCAQASKKPNSRSLLSIGDQLNLIFAEFIGGRALSSGLARCDPPKGEGIWRLKTTDLRLYGWADAKQTMVLSIGEFKSIVSAPGFPKDRDLGRLAVRNRKELGLEYIHGERYDLFPTAN